MKKWKVGDRVRVVEREQTLKDAKEQTYFPHFGGLVGSVVKVYEPDEVCVEVERESLPSSNTKRHLEIEKHLKDRLMENLSQDARSRLSEEEKRFHLSYTLLVASGDLEPFTGTPAPKAASAPPAADERPHEKDLEEKEEEFLRLRSEG
jgi:hypothetical protein